MRYLSLALTTIASLLLHVQLACAFVGGSFSQPARSKNGGSRPHVDVESPFVVKGTTGCSLRTYWTHLFLDPGFDQTLTGDLPLAPILVVLALTLFVAAQSFINQQLEGDQGLGAFLSDGSGYSKSGFRPIAKDEDRALGGEDPLPWLKLPKLDFVEVAGQQDTELDEDAKVFKTLESLRLELTQQLKEGNEAEAKAIQSKMEEIMVANGIDFQADE